MCVTMLFVTRTPVDLSEALKPTLQSNAVANKRPLHSNLSIHLILSLAVKCEKQLIPVQLNQFKAEASKIWPRYSLYEYKLSMKEAPATK